MNIVNNKKQYRFEAELEDGELLKLDYRWLKGSMVLMHTFVPVSARGSGKGNQIVQHVLDHARTQELKVIVYCSFVEKYVQEHPEYNDLLDEQHRR